MVGLTYQPEIRPLDGVDLNIVQLLRSDPRVSNKHIAKAIDVSETTVANRLRSMSKRNAMRVIAQRNIYHGKYNETALLYLSVSADQIDSIARHLSRLDGIINVSLTAGSPELVVNIRTWSKAHLHQLLNEEINHLAGLRSITTDFMLDVAKSAHGVGNLSTELPQTTSSKRNREIDDQIVAYLMTDGRTSNREIARRLDVSENNVRLRLQKMFENKELRLGVVCNPAAVGVSSTDWIRIKTVPAATETVVNWLVTNEACVFVAQTSGEYGILAIAHGDGSHNIAENHCREIANQDGVLEIQNHMLIQHFSHRYDLAYIDEDSEIAIRQNGNGKRKTEAKEA